MKLYTVDKPIPNWLLEHRDEIYTDVLIECEDKLDAKETDGKVDIALLKTSSGITRFIIKNRNGVIESLERCLAYFVEVEKYEMAARARDCIKGWKENE